MRTNTISILIVVLLAGAGFMGFGLFDMEGPIGETEALDITGLTTVSTNTNYGEDIYIKSGGTLRITAGVTVGMAVGTNIYVEDGTLEMIGQPNNKVWLQTSTAGMWGGIHANEDATVIITRAEIRFADVGIELLGTGHAGGSGFVSVNNTSFTTCTYGLSADGAGYSPPFQLAFRNNWINNPDYGIYIENGYNDVVIDNNGIYNAFEYGFYLAGIENVNVRNNTISDSHRALLLGGTVTENIVENNTVENCYLGFFGFFLGNAKFLNNSIFTISKSIFMPAAMNLLIENNTLTSTGNGWDGPVDVYDDDGLTTIKNNIISGCGPILFANGTSPSHFDIYDNLLLNLTELRYVDSMGDGFVDIRVPCPGAAGAFAYSCRTSVFYVNQPGIVESYVTPKQASEHARVGSTLKMISNPPGYGPKKLEARHIYHTQPPVIKWPMNFTGEERDYLVFLPGPCIFAPTIQNTWHAGLSNFTVKSGPNTVDVMGSHNVTLSNISSYAHDIMYFYGIRIDQSKDVTVENCYMHGSYTYGMRIEESSDVTVRDTTCTGSTGNGIEILRSGKVSGDNVTIRFTDNIGIVISESEVHFNNSEVIGDVNSVYVEDSANCEFTGCEFKTINTADHNVIVDNSRFTRFEDCDVPIGYKLSDIYGIMISDDCQYTTVEGCRFFGDPVVDNVLVGIYAMGNVSGSRFNNSTFSYTTAGIALSSVPTIDNRDIEVNGGLYAQNQFGVLCQFNGEIKIRGSTIRQGTFGIYSVEADITASDLNIYQVDIGAFFGMNEFNIRDSYINAYNESINATNTGDSMVVDTLLYNVPIALSQSGPGEGHILFDNCTGNEEETLIHTDGCYVNWTWPLQVNVYDDIGELQPVHLSVSSPTFGEVVNSSMDGSFRVDNLLGWWTNLSGHNDVSEYSIRVMDNENYQTDQQTMLSYQISEFIFNHAPTIEPSAPTEIILDEDEVWTDDISEWFNDRDSLTYELDEVLGDNISASLDGTTLRVTNSAENLHGEGRVILQAGDTFDEWIELNIDVYILPVNDPPVVLPLPVLNITEDGSEWLDLSGYVSDVDSTNLTWSNGTVENFTIEWTSPFNLTITPGPNWNGVQNIILFVTDGEHIIEAVLVVNVTPVNDPPIWTGDPVIHVEVDAGEERTMDISGYISDAESSLEGLLITSDSDHVAYSGGTLMISYRASTRNMTEIVTVTISDGDLSTSFSLNITVVEVLIPEEWEIGDSIVAVDPETGDWTVNATGGEGQDIYIVIDRIGSFKLEETSPGEYSVVIPASEFQEGEEYLFHFSDTDGGEDKTDGTHTGSIDQPVISDDDDTDDDDTDDDDTSGKDDDFPVWIIILVIVIVILLVVIIFLVVTNKGSSEDYYDEE